MYVLLWTASKGIERDCCAATRSEEDRIFKCIMMEEEEVYAPAENVSQADNPPEAVITHLSYAIAGEVIAIVSTTATASTRSATSL